MWPTRRTVLAGLLAAPLAASAGASRARGQDRTALAGLSPRLREGRMEAVTLPDGTERVLAVVDATFGRTLARLLDFGSYSAWLTPLVRRTRVLTRSRGRATVYFEAELPAGVTRWAELEVHIDGEPDGTHTLVARQLDGDMRALDARVAVVATPGRVRTLAAVTLRVDPAVPFVDPVGREASVRFVHALRTSLK